MVAMMDVDRSGKLGFEEFKALWIDIRHWKVKSQARNFKVSLFKITVIRIQDMHSLSYVEGLSYALVL
jgi:hypothetical protein